MVIADEKYVVLTVGAASSRARVVPLSDGRLALCPVDHVDADGLPVSVSSDGNDSPAVSGTVTVVRSGRAYDETLAKVRRKYGWRGRLSSTDAVLILRLE